MNRGAGMTVDDLLEENARLRDELTSARIRLGMERARGRSRLDPETLRRAGRALEAGAVPWQVAEHLGWRGELDELLEIIQREAA